MEYQIKKSKLLIDCLNYIAVKLYKPSIWNGMASQLEFNFWNFHRWNVGTLAKSGFYHMSIRRHSKMRFIDAR